MANENPNQGVKKNEPSRDEKGNIPSGERHEPGQTPSEPRQGQNRPGEKFPGEEKPKGRKPTGEEDESTE